MPTGPLPSTYLRRGILAIEPATVLSAVDSLNLKANSRLTAVVGVPLRGLQQRRDVVAFATAAPIVAVRALLELLAMPTLEKIVDVLGEAADSPSYDELSGALDGVLATGASRDDVIAVLVFAIGEHFPASGHCQRIIAERKEFELPPLEDVTPASSVLTPKVVDPEIRAQRRARREERKRGRKVDSPARPSRPVTAKPSQRVGAPPPAVHVADHYALERRRLMLTPMELARFDSDHPLVGAVVLVPVPFDSIDPAAPEVREKERPALVVGVAQSAVLVRAIYSHDSVHRIVFRPWRRLHLDHVSYIDGQRSVAEVTRVDALARVGRLTTEEWNALF